MHLFAVIYALFLSSILAVGVKSPKFGWLRTALAVFLLLWAVLIATSHFLTLFSALNITWVYVVTSAVFAFAISAGMRRLRPDHDMALGEFESPFSDRFGPWILVLLFLSAGLVILGDLVLAKGFLPANPDSIVYRFPRVYWYFSHGALSHFSNQGEPRPLFYPFNGTIAYLPLIHFQLGPRAFSFLSLLCWFVTGLSTYVFARDLGGTRVVAAFTAWLVFLTPNVLIQSLSTNDELIAAAPLVCGLFFLHRWYHLRQPFDALLGIIGLSISAGTKLHITFYLPLLIAVAVTFIFHYRAVVVELRGWLTLRGVAFLSLLLAIIAVFSFSFMFYNLRASGQAMAWDFAAQLQNKPFSLAAALQNVVLYTAQVVLTPIADLHLGSANDSLPRQLHYEAFNAFVAPLFSWVNNGPAFTSASYRFTGINSTQAILFNEQTVFIGFTWIVALIAAAWLSCQWNNRRGLWARFHLASLPIWFFTFAATTRYIEGLTVYLSYAVIVAGPAMVFAFAPIRHARLARARLFVILFVALTQVFFAASILYTSPAKNLTSLARATVRPSSRGFEVDQSVTDEIGRAKLGVYEHAIAWGQPYWAFMAYHPDIKHFLASQEAPKQFSSDEAKDPVSQALRYSRYVLTPRSDDPALHVYSFPQYPAYGHSVPIRIPDKASPGLTWIGNLLFALGPEWVFASGNDVSDRYAGRDRYIVIPYTELSNFGRNAEPVIQMTPTIYGLGLKDDLKFKFEIRIDGQIVSSSDWSSVPQVNLTTPGLKLGNGVLSVYVRNDNAGGTVYRTDALLQSTKPLDLAAK